tara:strand:- start:1875 stop:2183 length:309 start_codon:yes stop_codon:yes gene_type:complete
MNLSEDDYKTILNYYKIPHKRKSFRWIKNKSEKIIATKLCRCIKKVTKQSKLKEPAAIAICKKSILSRRKLKNSRFSCKKKYEFKNYPGKRFKLKKTKKNIF